MESIDKRLEALERAEGSAEDKEERIYREATARLTDEDLHLIAGVLDRLPEEGEFITEEDTKLLSDEECAALARHQRLCEEVRSEH